MAESRPFVTAFHKVLRPGQFHTERLPNEAAGKLLDVSVVFTSSKATAAALRTAGMLADSLNARIKLIAPQLVPYPLPLESPPILLDFSEHRLREIAKSSPVETTVQICLCRDTFDTLQAVLPPHSVVVVGGRRRWWRTREQSLAASLRRTGHEVIFTETE